MSIITEHNLDRPTTLRRKREAAWRGMRDAIEAAGPDGLAGENLDAYQRAAMDFDRYDGELKALEGGTVEDVGYVGSAPATGGEPRFGRALPRGARFADLPGHAYSGDTPTNLGRFLRGTVTGDFSGVPDELRAQTEGTDTEGGFLVPTPIASYVLDMARNEMVTAQAGVQIVPFDSRTFGVPVQTEDAVPTWREENASIGEDSIVFARRLFTARSLAVIVKASRELVEDAAQIGDVVGNSLAKSFALEFDRVTLRGSGTAPQPRGIRNWSGVDVDSLAGAPDWDDLVTAVSLVKAQNYTPTAQILATRTEADLAKQTGSDGHYVEPPSYLAGVTRYATNQVPTNLGTGTDESEIYTGDFRQIALGVRTSLQVLPLRERYAETGQVAWVGWARADVVVMRPEAFHIYSAVEAAA